MIRVLILLSPVYVSLFWFISLRTNKKNICQAAQILSIFMFIAAICFFGQYLFFAPYPNLFPYWEPVLAYLGSVAFPIYYIYFRLLTVDDKFTVQKHSKYLIIPILVATIYTIAIILTPFQQYKNWLYNDSLYADSPLISFLGIMRKIVKLTFVVLLIITYFSNRSLLNKYAHKAEQYYSDIQDGENNNAKLLNYFLVFISASCLIAHLVGRKLLLPRDTVIDVIWLIFAVSLYGIGYMGFKQKTINPTFELEGVNENEVTVAGTSLNLSQKIILDKLLIEFQKNKIFLNSNLNINDVAQLVGTNRTSVSNIINQEYSQNFCCFVNSFRLEEMKEVFAENPSLSNEVLAERSGFGSFNSMKRAIVSQTGHSVAEWKDRIFTTRMKIE